MTAAQSHTRQVPANRTPRLSAASNAQDAIQDFGPGRETYCLTFGQFSLIDAIQAVMEKTGPADVTVSTWTAGGADLTKSAQLLKDTKFRSMRWVVDCSFPQRQPGYAKALVTLFGHDAIRTTRTHAKFVLIVNENWKVVIRTSMNLNQNPRLETLEVSDDPALCDFLTNIVDTIFRQERPADYATKTTPELAGIPSVAPQQSIAAGLVVRVGNG